MKFRIVLVPFPFDDLTGHKVRPAVCLTDPLSGYNHLVLAFITSRTELAIEPSDILILDNHPQFKTTGLKQSSAVRLHRLLTIPKRIIHRKLGWLPEDLWEDVDNRLKEIFF